VKPSQNKTRSIFAVALAVIVVSPLDDIALSALFGSAVFGFGSTAFYALVVASSAVSVLIWKRHAVTARLRRLWQFSVQKHSGEQQLQIRT
jgi:O-antigen/teichoic acid export membrane protein